MAEDDAPVARPNRHLDVDHVEGLISERDLAIKDIARKMARTRYRRAPNEKEVENERRSLQRWLRGDAIEMAGQRRLAQALGEPVESLLAVQELVVADTKGGSTQPAPIAVMAAMQEALQNQTLALTRLDEIDTRLESLEGVVAKVADSVTKTLALLRAAQETRQAGRG